MKELKCRECDVVLVTIKKWAVIKTHSGGIICESCYLAKEEDMMSMDDLR
ncbi:MAG: hypothetical protein V3V41_07930 [Candidatus Heimdallarchaeota archaeon]